MTRKCRMCGMQQKKSLVQGANNHIKGLIEQQYPPGKSLLDRLVDHAIHLFENVEATAFQECLHLVCHLHLVRVY